MNPLLSLKSWCANLWRRASQRSCRRERHMNRRNRSSRSVQPMFELLEDRTVPATLSPLAAKSPLGSLLYESSGTGQVTEENPTDSFSLNLDAGQTLSVAVVPYMYGGHWYTLT